MKSAKLLTALLLMSGVIAACSSSHGNPQNTSNNGGSGSTPINPTTKQESVRLASVSKIPLFNNSVSLAITVNSNVNKNLRLVSAVVETPNGVKIDSTAQCTLLQSLGSCSLNITTPSITGNSLLKVRFIDDSNGEYYDANTIISYEKVAGAETSNGFILNKTQNNMVVPDNFQGSYIVPVVLTKDFDSVNVSSDTGYTAANLSCKAPFKKGDRCNVNIHYTGKNYASNIKLTGSNSSGSVTETLPINVKTDTTLGNVIIDRATVSVKADGKESTELNYVNNGNANVAFKAVAPTSPITILDDGCSNKTLQPTETCSVKLSATSELTALGTVSLPYDNGSGSDVTATVNVLYMGDDQAQLQIAETTQDNLTDTPVNAVQTTNVNIVNNGKATMTGLRFSHLTVPFELEQAAVNSCDINGNGHLNSNESCNIAIKYSPSKEESGTQLFTVAADYTMANGESASYSAGNLNIQYKAVGSAALLYMEPESTVLVKPNGIDTKTYKLTVSNQGGTTATSFKFNEPTFPSYVSKVNGEDCTQKNQLMAGESCSVIYTIGPVATPEESVNSYEFAVQYKATKYDANLITATSKLNINATGVAIGTPTVTYQGQDSGTGTDIDPLIFTNLVNKQLKVTYTYTNHGSEDALGFNVNSSNLPIGYAVDGSSTCSTGSNVMNFAPDAQCTLTVFAVDHTGLGDYANGISGDISLNIPGYSYHDSSDDMHLADGSLGKTTVTANLFGDVTVNATPVYDTATGTTSIALDVTASNIYAAGSGVTFKADTTKLNGITFASGGDSCTLTTASSICNVELAASAYVPWGNYQIPYTVTDNNTGSKLSEQSIAVKIGN